MRRALVLGGSGTVGREVVRALASSGAKVSFTWHTNERAARVLSSELGAEAIRADLRERVQLPAAEILVSCAAVATGTLDEMWSLNVRAPHDAIRALAPTLEDVVLVGALAPLQSVRIPPAFAATQGALSAMATAFAKELGPKARVNYVALGPLDGGLSQELDRKLLADFESFSALRRRGTAREIAPAIAWLALENRFLTGKVVPVNGGL